MLTTLVNSLVLHVLRVFNIMYLSITLIVYIQVHRDTDSERLFRTHSGQFWVPCCFVGDVSLPEGS